MSRTRKRSFKAIDGDRESGCDSAEEVEIADEEDYTLVKHYVNPVKDLDENYYISEGTKLGGTKKIARRFNIRGLQLQDIKHALGCSTNLQYFKITGERAVPNLPRYTKLHKKLEKIINDEIIKESVVEVVIVDSDAATSATPKRPALLHNAVPRMSMRELRDAKKSCVGQAIIVHLLIGAVRNDGKVIAERVAKRSSTSASR
jgi:hypothetical protein